MLTAFRPGWWDKPIAQSLQEWGDALSDLGSRAMAAIDDGVSYVSGGVKSLYASVTESHSPTPTETVAEAPKVEAPQQQQAVAFEPSHDVKNALAGISLSPAISHAEVSHADLGYGADHGVHNYGQARSQQQLMIG